MDTEGWQSISTDRLYLTFFFGFVFICFLISTRLKGRRVNKMFRIWKTFYLEGRELLQELCSIDISSNEVLALISWETDRCYRYWEGGL